MSTTIYHFSIKQGDTLPAIRCVLIDEGGTVVDPDNFDTVMFHMSKIRGKSITNLINAAGTVESMTYLGDTVNGVAYYWVAGDTDYAAGEYSAEWELTDDAGDVMTFPNNSYNVIHITAQAA